jgi:hypothetical protein
VTSTPPHAIPALVTHRIHPGRARSAFRAGEVVFSDEPNYHHHTGPRRYFWLLDTSVQLVYEPFGWCDEWYVDLVDIAVYREDGIEHFVVTDLYLDLVVEGVGPVYRILDLDELGAAMRDGALPVEAGANVLNRAQRFLDRYVHRGKVFPPSEITRWFSATHNYPAT